MSVVIKVENLTKQYKELTAVDGISFTVKEGTCFGLLGPNGAGKTTTIEMMEGLVKQSSGDILFFGQPINKQVLSDIGIQFQHTALQDFLTVEETIDMFSAFYPTVTDKTTLMDLCNLHEIADRDHKKLSGGQKQRLLLALALINDPKIIFLDEPTTGLDPHARRNFWDLINKVKQQGKTVVLTTHYMDEAEYLCDDIVIMDKGKIIAHNSPQGLLSEHFSGAIIRLPIENLKDEKPESYGRLFGEHHVDIDAEDVEKVISDLLSKKISLAGLQVKSANLDDLFIKLTGHQLLESEKEEQA
ncbi:ABC transporter ATP-binding protein [uncultured Psychrosphaera sp.]|uniref:ABC transporter ATP-binding protein n=1 Tax=uncultured Psychrosphaera sp. TaxID=1403522 RepID=UPI00262B7CD2|nr:ABC transporter ATP-binding protein [uncultured Psychrosphaera sp.]